MEKYHHKSIKRFNLSGTIHDESTLGRLKIEYIRLLSSEMRTLGYVPRIDIDPDFTIDYNSEKKIFNFELSVHGVYVGKRKSEWILGIDVSRPIYTVKNKLNAYSWV